MKIKLIGLGKMGLNIALNLKDHNYEVIGYSKTKATRDIANEKGIQTVNNIESLFNKKDEKNIIWLLVPNEAVEETLEKLLPYLNKGDIVVDAGNSNFNLSIMRHNKLKEKGIHFVDIGTSGGTNGARNGACLMVGGEKEIYEILKPMLQDISVEKGVAYIGDGG